MIDKIAGFNIGSSDPVDNRIVLTKEEMKLRGSGAAYPMPDVYFAICKEDGKMYVYNKKNEDDIELGKFRLYDSGTDIEVQYHSDDYCLEIFGMKQK